MPEQTKPPSIPEFFWVLWKDWGSRVSGGLSIPFTILALFAKANYTRAIWAILASVGILTTIYQVWSKERKRVVELEAALTKEQESNKPQLRGFVDTAVMIGKPDGVGVVVFATIQNTGSPSIVGDFKLKISAPDRPSPIVVEYPDTIPELMRLPGAPGEPFYAIYGSDALYLKTSESPIVKGGAARGILLFTVSGVTTGELVKSEATIELLFSDSSLKSYVSIPSTTTTGKHFRFPGLKSGPESFAAKGGL
jgi:hypothetical protein